MDVYTMATAFSEHIIVLASEYPQVRNTQLITHFLCGKKERAIYFW